MRIRDLKPGERILIEVEVVSNDPSSNWPVQIGPTRRRMWNMHQAGPDQDQEVWVDALTARECTWAPARQPATPEPGDTPERGAADAQTQ